MEEKYITFLKIKSKSKSLLKEMFMKNLTSETITKISLFFKKLQTKYVLVAIFGTLLFLTTNINPAFSDQSFSSKVSDTINEVFDQNSNSQRPETSAEWQQQARETEDRPVERMKRIGKQSAEAIKEFGAVFPDTAERSASALPSNNQNRTKNLNK